VVSKRIFVVPSKPLGTIPSATIAMDTAIVPWPHMWEYCVPSIQIRPASKPGSDGGVRNTPNMSRCPRGSSMSARRTQSYCSSKKARFSRMVERGGYMMPEWMMQVGSPSVWV